MSVSVRMDEYLTTLEQAIRMSDVDALERVVDVLYAAYESGNRVFTIGNGASAALASHMACDLGKGTAPDLGHGTEDSGAQRLRIISLVDNVALLTAYSNDIRYEDVFVEQLKNLLEFGDVVIAISGSGGSPNVLRAVEYAARRGATTIGFTGLQPSNRKLAALCDIVVRAPLTLMEQIEDMHVMFHHAVSIALRQRIADSPLTRSAIPSIRRMRPTPQELIASAEPTVAASL